MLCEPVPNTGQLPVLASSDLEQGHLMLRHVAADNDILFIIDLMKKETSQHWDPMELIDSFTESFTYIAGSEASQAFIIRLDGTPIFEIEIHEAIMQVDLHTGFLTAPGDYSLVLLAGGLDNATAEVYVQGLRLCLDYFFGFPEVRRIIVPLYAGLDKEQRGDLFEKAGIEKLLDKGQPKEPDLYMVARP